MGKLTPSGEQPYDLPALQSSEATGSQGVVTIHIYASFDGVGTQHIRIQVPAKDAGILHGKLEAAIKQALA
jgi:hypothetical protein